MKEKEKERKKSGEEGRKEGRWKKSKKNFGG